MGGDAEHRAVGMPEDHMATAWLTAHDAMGVCHHHEAVDSPISRSGFHSGQRLRGFRHFWMILLVILCGKRAMPHINNDIERQATAATSAAGWPGLEVRPGR